MKNLTKSGMFAMTLVLGATALSAQSCASVDHFTKASTHALAASGEASRAVGHSVAGSGRVVSGVVAVPVWVSGAVVAGSGAVVSAVGQSMAEGGDAVMQGGDKIWDFSNGDPAKRPALNREKALPPRTQAPEPIRDPSPAEALRSKT